MGNVVALLVDAQLLLDHGSPGRAQALGVLAAEELGKAWLLYSEAEHAWAGNLPDVEIPADFEKQARSHPAKITQAAQYGQGVSMMWEYWFASFASEAKSEEDLAVIAKQYNLKKQAGFYVDLAGEDVRSPSDVPADGVSGLLSEIAQAANMLLVEDHVRMQNSGEEPDWMHDVWQPIVQYGKKNFNKPARILEDQ